MSLTPTTVTHMVRCCAWGASPRESGYALRVPCPLSFCFGGGTLV